MTSAILERLRLAAESKPIRTPFDPVLLSTVIALLLLGLVMVASSSISIADRQTGQPLYYLWRQLAFTSIGILSGYVVFRLPLKVIEKSGPMLVMFSMVLLLVVFVPGLGRTVNGSTRWIGMGGINIQTTELCKLFTIIYLAGYLVRRSDVVRTSIGGFVRPMILLLVLSALMLLQPDYGAAAVMLSTAMGMMWMGGVRISQFAILLVSATGLLITLAVSSPYRMERLTAFLNPWADPFNSGFQLTQALIAFGRGELFGVGLGNSVQKLFYLPEAHTDFVFAVLGEELGMFGVITVISLYATLIARSLMIARRAEKQDRIFSAYLVYGLSLWLGLQTVINVGVNMGLLPTKGLTLPFMSYGGSSILVVCIAIALILRVDYEMRHRGHPAQAAKVGRQW